MFCTLCDHEISSIETISERLIAANDVIFAALVVSTVLAPPFTTPSSTVSAAAAVVGLAVKLEVTITTMALDAAPFVPTLAVVTTAFA